MSKQEELNQELEKLLHDTKMLLKTVEVKREEVYEGATGAIEKLNSTIKLMDKKMYHYNLYPKNYQLNLARLFLALQMSCTN
jgi:hypothetical protein